MDDFNFEDYVKLALERIEKKLDGQNGRLAKLEIWRGFITGGLAIIAFGVYAVFHIMNI